MKLKNIAVPTKIMQHGMTVFDFFEEATSCKVPGLPYANGEGKIVGRISVRNIYKKLAVPDNLLRVADMMGDLSDNLDPPEIEVAELMASPVEEYLLEKMPSVSSESSFVKALAIMELHNSSYIFLIDNGVYQGVATRMDLARRMLRIYKEQHTGKRPVS
jgi:CBS domain-containing protein